MNKIFERVIAIEDQLNILIEEVNMGIEKCPNNKEEIEHELIGASRAISRIYTLNKENYSDAHIKKYLDKDGKWH
jgi:uncharacterized protein (UPF0212 family)